MHEMLTACSDGRSLATIRTSLVMMIDHGDEMMLVKMQNDVLVVDGCGRPQGVDGC